MYIKLYYKSSKILNCCFSQNGQQFACGDDNGTVSLWRSADTIRNPIYIKVHSSSVNHMFFYSGLLCTGSFDGSCKLLDYNICKTVRTFKSLDFNSIDDLDCNKEIIITLNRVGTLTFWDKRSKIPVESISHGIFIKTVRFSHKPFLLYTAGNLPEIFIWDLRKLDKQKIKKFTMNKKNFHINSFSVSKKTRSLFVSDVANNYFQCYVDNLIQAVKFRNIQRIVFLNQNCIKTFIKTSSDRKARFFGQGDGNGNIFIWSQKSGKIVYNVKEHSEKINQVNFHPYNKIFCSCSKDMYVIIKKFYFGRIN